MNTDRPKVRIRLQTLTRRQWTTVIGVGLIAVVFAVALFTGLSRLLSRPSPGAVNPEATSIVSPPTTPAAAAVPKIKATLYFASEDGLSLVPMQSDVPLAEGTIAQARSILEAQLKAEAPAPLATTIPPGTTLRGIFISDRHEVFIDLDPAIRAAHHGGTHAELMTVYTIVNSLLTNLPDLQEVQILIGGQEADTLAGHVDLRRPLKKNDAIVASSQ